MRKMERTAGVRARKMKKWVFHAFMGSVDYFEVQSLAFFYRYPWLAQLCSHYIEENLDNSPWSVSRCLPTGESECPSRMMNSQDFPKVEVSVNTVMFTVPKIETCNICRLNNSLGVFIFSFLMLMTLLTGRHSYLMNRLLALCLP